MSGDDEELLSWLTWKLETFLSKYEFDGDNAQINHSRIRYKKHLRMKTVT